MLRLKRFSVSMDWPEEVWNVPLMSSKSKAVSHSDLKYKALTRTIVVRLLMLPARCGGTVQIIMYRCLTNLDLMRQIYDLGGIICHGFMGKI